MISRSILPLALALAAALSAAAQQPLYLVNGERRDDIASIPPDEIERMEELPADEETIARYGEEAANGVLLITLRFDEAARFTAAESFDAYIARQVAWADDDPVARVVVRYTVTPEGRAVAGEVLQSTDSRLRRRVLKAIAEAPDWLPARKNGAPVASEGVLRCQLPAGQRLPPEVELIWR